MGKMNPHNRLHSFTRWPSDPYRRLELAEVDLGFADAVCKIMGEGIPEINRIAFRAFQVEFRAQDELRESGADHWHPDRLR